MDPVIANKDLFLICFKKYENAISIHVHCYKSNLMKGCLQKREKQININLSRPLAITKLFQLFLMSNSSCILFLLHT